MSIGLNHLTIAGNLTRDPETRAAGASTVTQFSLAINRKWKWQVL
jgi:single-stranded DNA-binding protein